MEKKLVHFSSVDHFDLISHNNEDWGIVMRNEKEELMINMTRSQLISLKEMIDQLLHKTKMSREDVIRRFYKDDKTMTKGCLEQIINSCCH